MRKRKRNIIVALVVAIISLILGVVVPLGPFVSADGTVNICVMQNGTSYFLTPTSGLCRTGETKKTWNLFGVANPELPVGSQANPGMEGIRAGPTGQVPVSGQQPVNVQGPAGAYSLTELQGAPCTQGVASGSVNVRVDPKTRQVTLDCLLPDDVLGNPNPSMKSNNGDDYRRYLYYGTEKNLSNDPAPYQLEVENGANFNFLTFPDAAGDTGGSPPKR